MLLQTASSATHRLGAGGALLAAAVGDAPVADHAGVAPRPAHPGLADTLTNKRGLLWSRDQPSANYSSPGPSRRHSRCAGSPWGRTGSGCSRGQS